MQSRDTSLDSGHANELTGAEQQYDDANEDDAASEALDEDDDLALQFDDDNSDAGVSEDSHAVSENSDADVGGDDEADVDEKPTYRSRDAYPEDFDWVVGGGEAGYPDAGYRGAGYGDAEAGYAAPPGAAPPGQTVGEDILQVDPLDPFASRSIVMQPKNTVRVWPKQTESFFYSLGVARQVCEGLQSCGFTRANPIQRGAWDPILAGGDVVVAAETGSGKTLAYLVPVMHRMLQERRPRVLILQPNRELCFQVADVAQGLIDKLSFDNVQVRLDNVCAIKDYEPSQYADIVVATPDSWLLAFSDEQVRGWEQVEWHL